MLIPDPIHDEKFKRLMESERMIRFFIGALLEETVESLAIPEQEFIYQIAESGTSVFRLCFIATFKARAGERSKALIQIRKAFGTVRPPALSRQRLVRPVQRDRPRRRH